MKKYCLNCMREIASGTFCADCVNQEIPETAPHQLKPGTVLNGKYLIGTVIGEGGFGITYIGRDLVLEKKVAVKEFYPMGHINRNNEKSGYLTISTEEQRELVRKGMDRFLEEARNVAQFSEEPGIVDVKDFFEENDTAYIIMEYLEGKTLASHVRELGTLNTERVFDLMIPVINALSKMHKLGVIHRDISPDNMMYLSKGTLKLMDFGAARYYMERNRELTSTIKRGYAPEEQYTSNSEQGPWTDVYGLCATIYKCITGVTPTDALERISQDHLKRPSELGTRITPQLENALMYGLALHAKDRCRSMEELLHLVQAGMREVREAENAEDYTVYAERTLYTGASGYSGAGGRTGDGRYTGPGGYTEQRSYTGPGGYAEQGRYTEPGGYTEQGRYTEPGSYRGPGGYTEQRGYTGPGGYAEQGRYTAPGDYTEQGRYAGPGGYTEQGRYAGPGGYNGLGNDTEQRRTTERNEHMGWGIPPKAMENEGKSSKTGKNKFLKPAIAGGVIAIAAAVILVKNFLPKNDAKVETSGDYYVTGCKEVLKVREEEDKESKVLTKLDNGEKVSLMEKSEGNYWKVYIEAEEVIGYIDYHYLTNKSDAVTDPVTRYVNVKKDASLTIFSTPDEDGAALGMAERGDEVTVLAKPDETYAYIYAADESAYGYVERSKLSEDKPKEETKESAKKEDSAPAQAQAATEVLGAGSPPSSYQGVYYVNVASGYLALRNAKAFDASNEIGKMYNGDYVQAIRTNEQYWYVYSPSLGAYGYTNSDYLAGSAPSSGSAKAYDNIYYASVSSGYLALRSAQAYDASNEIGKIANGQEVSVVDVSGGTYWYVYVPALDQYGYVNSEYLRR